MGYTHDWKQGDFTKAEWADIKRDVAVILQKAMEEGVTIGDAFGEVGAVFRTEAWGEDIAFNGFGDESCETFWIGQKRAPLESWQTPAQRGRAFCKTARRPYDVAVTACLCYLESVYPKKLQADSDGGVEDWQEGLALARRALPRLDNVLHIPAVVTFDSLFTRTLYAAGDYAVRETGDGSVHYVDRTHLAVLHTFHKGEPEAWVRHWAESMWKQRQARLPAKLTALESWGKRKMREMIGAAESFGYVTAA
jgi:hypothetical protein